MILNNNMFYFHINLKNVIKKKMSLLVSIYIIYDKIYLLVFYDIYYVIAERLGIQFPDVICD